LTIGANENDPTKQISIYDLSYKERLKMPKKKLKKPKKKLFSKLKNIVGQI